MSINTFQAIFHTISFFSSFSGLKKKLHALKLSKSNSDLVDHTDHETLEKVYIKIFILFCFKLYFYLVLEYETQQIRKLFFCYCFSTQPVPPIWG